MNISLSFGEAVAFTLAAGLCLMAMVLALQPLLWDAPVPTAAELHAAHADE